MLISVIIPTLNEEANLPVTLRQLAERADVELIVVDGGSMDGTVEIAQQFTPFVFVTRPGRAQQMNIGARHATGDILLFLHADTFLLPGALDELQRRIIGDGAVGGAFDLNIDSPRRLCKLVAKVASRRGMPNVLNQPGETTFVNVWVTLLYFLRLPPRQLRRIYDGWLVTGKSRRDKSELRPPSKRSLQGQP